MHGTVSSTAEILLLLIGGVDLKREYIRRGSIVHGTVSNTSEILLLLFSGVDLKRESNMRGNIVHGTVSSAAVIILQIVVWVGEKRAGDCGKHFAWNSKKGSSDYITVRWSFGV